MLKIKIITKDNEKKVFDVDSDTFDNAKKRILKLYPNIKYFELINGNAKEKELKKEKEEKSYE